MLVSTEWLKEIISFKYTPKELAYRLSMQGIETKVSSRMGRDSIIETEPTSNRPDCLSVIGLAREIRAMNHHHHHHLKLRLPKRNTKTPIGTKCPIQVHIKNDRLCPRYVGAYLTDIIVKKSPEWLSRRLELMGMRSVNNVVDVTNYVLLEWGHPTHAFDADLIEENTICIDTAGRKTQITTLDGVKRDIMPDTLLISDETKPIAVAGVIGAANTEIHKGTNNIFLESAYFDPASVRRTSKHLGLSTESSYRFERGADPDAALSALQRIIVILEEVASARVIGSIIDAYPRRIRPPRIAVRPSRVNQILGTCLTDRDITRILSGLDFGVEKQRNPKAVKVSVPPFRMEVQREIDVIEEIARIYGYHNIAKDAPQIPIQPVETPLRERTLNNLKTHLVHLGIFEVITYSFVSGQDLNLEKDVVRIPNPLSVEQSVMRTTLIPGLLKVANHNISVQEVPNIFEIGKIYTQSHNKTKEKYCLGLLLIKDFFEVKGIIERLSYVLEIDLIFQNSRHPWLNPRESSRMMYGKECVGLIGRVHPDVAKQYGVSDDICIAEINLENLMDGVGKDKKCFQRLSRFPAVKRDMALILHERVSYQECVDCIRGHGGEWLGRIELFDIYRGKPLESGYKSLGFSLEYQDQHRTLSETDVDAPHNAILEACFKELGATLRPQ